MTALELSQRPPSQVEAALPREAAALSLTGALKALEAAALPLEHIEPAGDRALQNTLWEVTVEWRLDDGETWPLRIYARATEQELFGFHVELGRLRPDVAEAVRTCRYGIGVRCVLREPVVWHYHAQLRLLHALAPDAAGVLDVSAARARSPEWLQEAALSGVPPHPENLFSIHAVHDEGRMWMHTHGLHRCGVIELDLLDVPMDDAWGPQHLMNTIAKRFIDQGYPEPDEVFEPAAGVQLVWLPVSQALNALGRQAVGGDDDRDPIHSDDRGVIVRKTPGWLWGHRYENLEALVPLLEDNPLLYVSTAETLRAAALARERLPRFVALFEQLEGHPGFTFLVKLGFSMDGAPEDEREHLWFEVHDLEGDDVDATCLNAPYHVAALAEGQRDRHSLGHLSDWAIVGPVGQIGPDRVRVVEEIARDADALEQLRASFEER